MKLKSSVVNFRIGGMDTFFRYRIDTESAQHIIARRDLLRYYELIETTCRAMRLNTNEWSLIIDALNGTIFPDVSMIVSVKYEIFDALALNQLAKKWDVDESAFRVKIDGWTELECIAVIDAAEQYWNMVKDPDEPLTHEAALQLLMKGEEYNA